MKNIQAKLDEIAARYDSRVTVFDIQIKAARNSSLKLGGRLFDLSQMEEIYRAFPDTELDVTSIRFLNRNDAPRWSVATNLTGLYEKPTFYMALSSELYFGTELEILDERDNWAFTRQTDGYLGWAYKPYLTNKKLEDATHLVLAPSCELRASPDEEGEIITRIFSGTAVRAEETFKGWTKIGANHSGWIPASSLRALLDIPKTPGEKRSALLKDAERMIGVPYLWGGTSGNGIDCSGLSRLLHRWIGLEIPRDADMQCAAAKIVEPPFEIGDLLFFAEDDDRKKISHVGVSLGGWRTIHSSRSRNGVYVDNVSKTKFLKDIFASAGSFLRQ